MNSFPVRRPKLSKYKRGGRLHIHTYPTGLGIGQKLVRR